MTPQQKAWYIYKHLDKVDWQGVAKSIAANQVEDWFYGQVGKVMGKAAKKQNRFVGFQLGGSTQRAPTNYLRSGIKEL